MGVPAGRVGLGHLVNTSSIFGVFAGTLGPYGVSKHAVTALTETLYFNLKSQGADHVGVSVLCPGAVRTNFGRSSRNRPAWAGAAGAGAAGAGAAGVDGVAGINAPAWTTPDPLMAGLPYWAGVAVG